MDVVVKMARAVGGRWWLTTQIMLCWLAVVCWFKYPVICEMSASRNITVIHISKSFSKDTNTHLDTIFTDLERDITLARPSRWDEESVGRERRGERWGTMVEKVTLQLVEDNRNIPGRQERTSCSTL